MREASSASHVPIRVAIIGGYGNFGGYVARSLAEEANVHLIIAGRSLGKAQAFAEHLGAVIPAEAGVYDLAGPPEAMAALNPDLVINMVGPYNDQGYAVAEAAIRCGAHYCDIADAREFVAGIGVLDEAAKAAGVAVLAGASSVPALTAAYLDEAQREMQVHSVQYGISGAEQANRGAGTVAAVLRYVGQPFTELRDSEVQEVRGWSDLRAVPIPGLGRRWFGRGNVPDLALFSDRYEGLRNHSFWAGHEIPLLHFGTALMGWLARVGLLPRLDRFAPQLVEVSKLFNWMGRGRSGFFIEIEGVKPDGSAAIHRRWIVARNGHGPYIPCIPVIRIAERMAKGERFEAGARPCLGIITLDEYCKATDRLDVEWIDE